MTLFKYFILVIIFAIIISLFYHKEEKSKSDSKVLLGKVLFFDTSLSVNNTKSCASCHNPTFAFSDGYRQSATSLGENTLHNAPSLINVVRLKGFDWANPTIASLEKQMERPLFGKHPVELGADKKLKFLQELFAQENEYKYLIDKVYGNKNSLSTQQIIIQSIVAYLYKLESKNSKYDQYLAGNKSTLNSSQKNGMDLFFSTKLGCKNCHQAPDFTLATQGKLNFFENIGLYNVQNRDEYPEHDNGIIQITKKVKDNGKFKIPSLRNVAITQPYMHDGSIATLGEVVDMYSAGGRNITNGPLKGDGRKNKYKNILISGFKITNQEKFDLINFLSSLTDSTIFINPIFKSPVQIH